MPSVQRRNDQSTDIQGADVIRNGYQFMHEPIGDVGLWNGQFQLGGDPFPEGWELNPTGTIARDTSGWAGNYCLKGGNAGMAIGGYANTLRYFPVNDTERDYYVSCVAKGSTANSLYNMGAYCYDTNKALLGTVWTLAAPETAPGVAWVRRQRKIGPNGDVAWPANTRYARPVWGLQIDAGLTGEYIWIDDCQFHQLEMTYSPQILLIDDSVYDTTTRVFDKAAWTLHPASTMNITLEEPGYIRYSYNLFGRNNTGARAQSWGLIVYVDGVNVGVRTDTCSPAATYMMTIHVGWRTAALAIGAHTIDLRIYVWGGDTINTYRLYGQCWYTREK